jgi:hypothetical protein
MLLAGSVLDRLPGAKYLAKLRFVEFAPRDPLPRVPTLRRMRGELRAPCTISLRAPKSALVSARGPLRFDAELERGFEWLLQARDALAAKLVVLPTPPDLTPGKRDRDLFAALCARLPREAGRHWVWDPSGPWEPEAAAAFARELGLVLAFDPLIAPRPIGDVTYARLRALGARKSFSEAALEDVVAQVGGEGDAETFVAFDAERSFEPAVRLQKIAGGLEGGASSAGDDGGEDEDESDEDELDVDEDDEDLDDEDDDSDDDAEP